jgi:hypothetical protein
VRCPAAPESEREVNSIVGVLAGGPGGAAAGGLGAAGGAISRLGSLSCAASLQGDAVFRSLQGSLGGAAPAAPAAGIEAPGVEKALRMGLGWLTERFGGGAKAGLAAEAVQLALPLVV